MRLVDAVKRTDQELQEQRKICGELAISLRCQEMECRRVQDELKFEGNFTSCGVQQ